MEPTSQFDTAEIIRIEGQYREAFIRFIQEKYKLDLNKIMKDYCAWVINDD